jgi:hypothetical protein
MKKILNYWYMMLLIAIMAVLFGWFLVSFLFVTILTIALGIIFGIGYVIYFGFKKIFKK